MSDFPSFRVSEFPSFRVSEFPSFRLTEFPSFRVTEFLSLQVSKFPKEANERPGTDHVILRPMRGLYKNCTRWLNRQTDRHTEGHGDLLTNSAQWGRVGENGCKTCHKGKTIIYIRFNIIFIIYLLSVKSLFWKSAFS